MKINRIKAVLADRGITQVKLAKLLKEKGYYKNTVTISRWCRNVQQPTLEMLRIIADTLEVNICELLVNNQNQTVPNVDASIKSESKKSEKPKN